MNENTEHLLGFVHTSRGQQIFEQEYYRKFELKLQFMLISFIFICLILSPE